MVVLNENQEARLRRLVFNIIHPKRSESNYVNEYRTFQKLVEKTSPQQLQKIVQEQEELRAKARKSLGMK